MPITLAAYILYRTNRENLRKETQKKTDDLKRIEPEIRFTNQDDLTFSMYVNKFGHWQS